MMLVPLPGQRPTRLPSSPTETTGTASTPTAERNSTESGSISAFWRTRCSLARASSVPACSRRRSSLSSISCTRPVTTGPLGGLRGACWISGLGPTAAADCALSSFRSAEKSGGSGSAPSGLDPLLMYRPNAARRGGRRHSAHSAVSEAAAMMRGNEPWRRPTCGGRGARGGCGVDEDGRSWSGRTQDGGNCVRGVHGPVGRMWERSCGGLVFR
mmetsp:Transcript_10937/g.37203  ORF Transcript_10937/g.37203 Transcript_10937/m.37203 type:complete len:214 (-) Transcript_10937:681-1322(-)